MTNFAELHENIFRGTSKGNILWQPRIQCWIDDKIFEEGKLPLPYTGMSKSQIYRQLGCSARIYEYNGCIKKILDPKIEKTTQKLSPLETLTTIKTPKGSVSQIDRANTSNGGTQPSKWFVETEEDLKIMAYIEDHTAWEWDQVHYENTFAEWGDLGAPTIFLERTSIQRLYIDLMGIESAIYATVDYQNTVDYYFQALHSSHEKLIDVVNKSPINIINFGDNIHAGTLPPYMFETYVLPYYQKRCELLKKGNKFTHAHWDGDVAPLLPYLKDTMLNGIEAITPKPQGDVTLSQIKDHIGEMVLIDGIAAILFDTDYSIETLVEQTHQLIDLFAPRLILGISDEISSLGDIERVKIIGNIVESYNSKIT